MASVKIKALHKRFGPVHAVRGIDLDIPDGEFTVLVGPSGCGKSTLLRTIAGLEDADAGDIAIGGEAVNGMRPRDRDVAMVFQDYALYPHMTVFGNISLSLRARRMPKSEIKGLHQEISTTMIYVTHDQVEAMTLADRIVLLRDGVIEQQGAPLDLFEKPATLFVAGFLGSPKMNFLNGALERADGAAAVALGDSAPKLALP